MYSTFTQIPLNTRPRYLTFLSTGVHEDRAKRHTEFVCIFIHFMEHPVSHSCGLGEILPHDRDEFTISKTCI